MGKAFEEYEEMIAAKIEARNDFDKKINKLIDSVGLMPTLVEFLKDFYEESSGCYSEIYFVKATEPADEYIFIGNIYLRVSNNGYIDVLDLTGEEQEQLKKELPKYRFE